MNRLVIALAASTALALAPPALAQDHSQHQGMDMPGMTPVPARKPVPKKPAPKPVPKKRAAKPPPKPAAKPAPKPAPKLAAAPSGGMEGMDHSVHDSTSQTPPAADSAKPAEPMPGMDMQNHSQHGAAPAEAHGGMQMIGTALPAGDAPAPPPPMDHYADRQFPRGEMARARERMMREQGGQTFYQVMFNLAEYRAHQGRDGYHWDGEAFVGGDIDRLWLKSEGEGAFGDALEGAEVQLLYSRAIDPYFNLQAGIRQDFGPGPDRTYATVGFEGLAPYMFEVEGALFLSDKGDLLGRIEGYYDQRISQRLILQPRVEFNLSAQNMPANRIGAGLTDAELGLRLRYEITRQFAPYIGVSYEAKTGRTADFARADGEDPSTTSLVAGMRIWF